MRATSFPTWWDVNAVRVHHDASPPTLEAMLAEADAWLAGFEHRKVELEDEATGRPLAEAFRALGWNVDRIVSMRRDEALSPLPPGSAFTELTDAQVDDLSVRWLLEEEVMHDETSIRAYLADEAAAERRRPGTVTALGIAGSAFVTVRIDGADGEIEDAYVTTEARGAGVGTELLHAAVERATLAGVSDLWIFVDADGRPRHLYERLGFVPEWTYWDCVRRPPAKSDAPRR